MSEGITVSAAAIVAVARAWLGTPYHHQASVRGIGTDCLGLVRGVWRELYGAEAEVPPAYSRDWAEASGIETMLGAAGRHLIPLSVADIASPLSVAEISSPLSVAEISSGDVVIFRLRVGLVAKHAAILTSATTMIHAIEGAPVSEVAFSHWWRRRIAGAFRFPNRDERQ